MISKGKHTFLTFSILFNIVFSSLGTPTTETGEDPVNQKAVQFFNRLEMDSAQFYLEKIVDLNNINCKEDVQYAILLFETYRSNQNFTEAGQLLPILDEKLNTCGDLIIPGSRADWLQYKGAYFAEKKDFHRAKILLTQSVELRQNIDKEDTLLAYAYNKLGNICMSHQKYDSALINYENALQLSLLKSKPDNIESGSYYQNAGIVFDLLGNAVKAEEYLLRSIEIKEKSLEEGNPKLARGYLNLGQFYFRNSNIPRTIEFYQRAEKVYLAKYSPDDVNMASIYWNIGNYYIISGDFERALVYLNNVLFIYNENVGTVTLDPQKLYSDIGYAYLQSEEYNKAAEFAIKAVSGNDNISDIKTYRILARAYDNLNQPEFAELYFKKAIATSQSYESTKVDLMLSYRYYAHFLKKIGRHGDALINFKKALEVSKSIYGSKNRELAWCYRDIGEFYVGLSDFQKALPYFQQALIAGIYNFSNTSIYANPDIEDIITDNLLFNVLNEKAFSLKDYYFTESGNEKDIRVSIETYDLALDLSRSLLDTYTSEKSKLLVMNQIKDAYNHNISLLAYFYGETDDHTFLTQAFDLAEKSKSTLLLGALKDEEAKILGNLQPEHLVKEKQIKQNLAYYENLIYEEELKPNPSSQKLGEFRNRLFDVKLQLDSLVSFFESEYPSYYSLKYDDKVISPSDIQSKLTADQALLEYVILDTSLVTFVISQNKADAYIQKLDSSFYSHIEQFRQILKHDGNVNNDTNDYANYLVASQSLYNLLIKPVVSQGEYKELIIIPDGEIGYISFDMLLSSLPDYKHMDYRKLDYALKDFVFCYSSSATIHFTDFEKPGLRQHNQVLAFAPDYGPKVTKQSNSAADNTSIIRGSLQALPSVDEEVESVLKIYSGRKYMDKEATELNFKENAEDFHILHLAMHTIIDDKNPLYSYLVFANKENDTVNDGLLNTYEIFNMDFKGELAVLSACNTGTGKLERGEGIMSLARGFIYSGIPSIVMTLWTVEDKPSADLITTFYKFLADGAPKHIAMNKAKREFLNRAGPLDSHPYFWAGYVNIGDVSPLNIMARNPMRILIPLISGILIILIIILLNRRKKKLSSG